MTLAYRHPVEQDIDLITSITNISRRETAYHHDLTPAELNSETFDDPDYSPEGAWLVFDGTIPIAYGIGVIEEGRIQAGLDDGWVEIDVIPEARGCGAEEELMRLALDYIKSRGVGRAMAKIEETEGWKKDLYLRSGFKSVRHFYRLARRDKGDIPQRKFPSGIEVTHRMLKEMSDDEIAVFTEILNDTFSEHFSFAPEPQRRWTRWRDACDDPWMVSMARKSSETVALCVAEVPMRFNANHGIQSGWIDLLGVTKAMRGQGLGTAMLVDGMKWLESKGHDTIFIGVDAKNDKALGLYISLGFKVENESQVYHLVFEEKSALH
ncbi:MAG: GNAT family N-acetyltransferase [Methanomassiliicoccus sp.]|nr:MAG: GNAT family N-acetyltransferase [Methanomassiliicoccus sp.]